MAFFLPIHCHYYTLADTLHTRWNTYILPFPSSSLQSSESILPPFLSRISLIYHLYGYIILLLLPSFLRFNYHCLCLPPHHSCHMPCCLWLLLPSSSHFIHSLSFSFERMYVIMLCMVTYMLHMTYYIILLSDIYATHGWSSFYFSCMHGEREYHFLPFLRGERDSHMD